MADKEATLKLTLKSDGFKAGLNDAEKAAAKAGANMGKGLAKGLSDAGKAGIDALKGSLMSLKNAIGTVAGIGGGLGLVDMARRAIEGAAQFRKLSAQIRFGTGEMIAWRDIQKDAQATALKFGHTTEEVGKSISDLYAAVGDPKFAKEASKVVAEFATGAHEPLEVMTNLAGGLNEKFGVTAQQLPDVLASVVSLGNKGGVSVADLADKIGIIGANARVAGLDGAKGFGTMVSWLNVADNATGTLKKGITGVSGIIDAIATGSIKQPLQQKLGIDLDKLKKSGADFNKIVGTIFEKTGGKESKLAQIFSGDQLKVISELGRTYAQSFEETKGDVKAKTKAGLEAYEAALKEAGKTQVDANAIREEAAREMETPEKKIATALEKLAQTFTSEKFTKAFEQLGEFLPKVIEQVMKHPVLTGALLSGVPQAIAGSLGKSLMEGIGGLFKGGFFKGAGGGALAIGAGALAAYEGGKALIDQHFEQQESRDAGVRAESIDATNMLSASRTMVGGTPAQLAFLAQEALAKADAMKERIDIANSDDPNYDISQRAHRALPTANDDDIGEWIRAAKIQRDTDLRNMKALMTGEQDARRAAANFAYAAGGYQLHGMGASRTEAADRSSYIGMHPTGEAQFGLGLGGDVKTNRQKREEEAAAKEAARVENQKQDYKGLIDGITAGFHKAPLSVNVLNTAEFKDTKPGQGSNPT